MFKNKKGSITSTIAIMFIIMISINIGLAFTQAGVTSLSPDAERFFNDSTSPYNNYITGDITSGDVTLGDDYLPSDEEIVGDTGNLLTDTYNSAKSWLKQKLEPLSFVSNLFSQPRGFLLMIGIPSSIALAIQVIWNGIILLFFTAWIFGRN